MRKLLPGFIPLIILIIAGIVIAGAGGTYIVRKQFIKKGQSGKAALDEKKIAQQLNNPVELESPSPKPTPQLAGPKKTLPPVKRHFSLRTKIKRTPNRPLFILSLQTYKLISKRSRKT